jgi:hypothetical protein
MAQGAGRVELPTILYASPLDILSPAGAQGGLVWCSQTYAIGPTLYANAVRYGLCWGENSVS